MPPPVLPNTAGMSLPQMGIDPGISGGFLSLNDWLSKWGFTLPGFSPTPSAPQPMVKGQPQAPASEGDQSQRQQSTLRDVLIYGGAALVVIIGLVAVLR